MFRRSAYPIVAGAFLSLIVVLVLIVATSARADGYIPEPQMPGQLITSGDVREVNEQFEQNALCWEKKARLMRLRLLRLTMIVHTFPPKSMPEKYVSDDMRLAHYIFDHNGQWPDERFLLLDWKRYRDDCRHAYFDYRLRYKRLMVWLETQDNRVPMR